MFGFLLGLGLLGWTLSLALSEESVRGFRRLGDASPGRAIGLLALTAASVVVNGLAFWVAILPVRRLGAIEVLAVNAICTLLAYLPFKLSIIMRIAIHRQRDGMTYKRLLAWFAAVGIVAVLALGPLIAAGLIRRQVDEIWLLIVTGGVAAALILGVVAARIIRRSTRLNRWTFGSAEMMGHARAVLAQTLVRLVDVLIHTGRFLVAALILGAELDAAGALLLATTYYLAGVLSPTGALGAREGAVVGMGALAASSGLGSGALASIALVITASEAATYMALGVPSAIYLRLDRIMRGAGGRGTDANV